MGVYIGVDFHARTQSVCWCDTATGEIQERVLDHQRDDVRAFYAQFAAPAVVGLESSGYALWFHQLVEELGLQLRVGNAFAIRQFARRRQKNDRRVPHRCSHLNDPIRKKPQRTDHAHRAGLWLRPPFM